ncbi:hypothetical protein [Halodesulfurarchaeum formicicum]|uniref:hypothetical protein n=1 Tax=Halodesulfurarchaeum formicicum TaxID=1873524 RepID=UPI000B02D754|nr:hypothetical protein [Halodesulfurarchaeum formicicum]
MPSRGWGSGDVLSRRVGAHIDELVPKTIGDVDSVQFTGTGAMRNCILPESAVGGIIELRAQVGEHSQFELTVTQRMQKRRGGSEGESPDWTIETTFARTEQSGHTKLDPFHYAVAVREQTPAGATSESTVRSLEAIATHDGYGHEESIAALLLTEIVANRKASTDSERSSRVSHAGSLAMLGSFNSAVDQGRIPWDEGSLDWQTVDELLGPDAETLAATVNVETAVSETQRRAAAKGRHFPAATAADGNSDANPGTTEQLSELLAEIQSVTLEIDGPTITASSATVKRQRARLESMLESYPERFSAALRDGNFGIAARAAADVSEPYEKLVLVYAFAELYHAIEELQRSEAAVRQIAAAITAFGTAIDRGNAEMAELSLKRASDAFVVVTKQLVNGAQPRLDDLRGVLTYHDLGDTFDRHVDRREELGRSARSEYDAVADGLVAAARRQHERAEKAREAFYLFTNERSR